MLQSRRGELGRGTVPDRTASALGVLQRLPLEYRRHLLHGSGDRDRRESRYRAHFKPRAPQTALQRTGTEDCPGVAASPGARAWLTTAAPSTGSQPGSAGYAAYGRGLSRSQWRGDLPEPRGGGDL